MLTLQDTGCWKLLLDFRLYFEMKFENYARFRGYNFIQVSKWVDANEFDCW